MKPVVGYTTYYVRSDEFDHKRVRGIRGQDMIMSTMDYSRALEMADMLPLAIPALENKEDLKLVVDRIDALLLTGGGDVKPKYYAEEEMKGFGKAEDKRDSQELMLLELAIKAGKPVLGICRGFQLINVYFGGNLIQDNFTYLDKPLEHVRMDLPRNSKVHEVKFRSGSVFERIFGQDKIEVNSFHHQCIDRLGDGLNADGVSPDGIIEAISLDSNDNVFAVQWHPEMMLPDVKEQLVIFTHFKKLIKEDN